MNKSFYNKFHRLLLICLIFSVSQIHSQVNLTSYHQFNDSSKTNFNPAMYDNSDAKLDIAFMNMDLGFHSNYKYSDIIHKGTGVYSDSLVLDFPKFRSATGTANHFSIGNDLTLFRVSLKLGTPNEKTQYDELPHQLTVGLRYRVMTNMSFNNDFVTLFTQGNADTYTDLLTGSLGLNATAMRELSVGYGRRMNKRFWAGINLKYLQGYYNIATSKFNLGMQGVDFENYIDVTSSAEFRVSGPVTFEYDTNQFISGADFTSPDFGLSDMFFSKGNPGVAVDLGIVYEPTDGLVFSASLTDLGSIRWKEDSKIIEQNTTYRYNPADLSDSYDEALENYISPDDVLDALTEDFKQSFKVYETELAYTQSLPYQMYLGARYTINPKLNAGLVYSKQVFRHFDQELLATSLNAFVLKFLSLSGNLVLDGEDAYFGVGGSLSLGSIQLSMALNNLNAVADPANANTAAFKFGLRIRI